MRSYFPWLDLLRFAAALSVAFFHLFFWSWAGDVRGFDRYIYADVQFPSAAAFTWFGWVGVEIFFVISGFVIANSASKASPTEFLINRALRLYPAVWVCSTATFAVLFIFARGSLSDFVGPYIRSMLIFPRGPWIDGVLWTLTAEIAFYMLVFGLLSQKRFTLTHLAWALTVYSGIYNAFELLVALRMPSSALYWFLAWHRTSAAILLTYHGCFFALGIWFWAAANRRLRPLELVGLVLAFLSGTLEIYNTSESTVMHLGAISGQQSIAAAVPMAVFAAAMCMVGLAARGSRRPSKKSGSSAGYLRAVGLMTYPLYLTHNTVGAAIARVLIATGLDATLAVWLALVGLISLCWLFCSTFEPMIRGAMKLGFSYAGLLPARRRESAPA